MSTHIHAFTITTLKLSMVLGFNIFSHQSMGILRYSIEDERKTVQLMITMYCNSHHNTEKNELCINCLGLLNYSLSRIDDCVYGTNKPTCEKCPVHCYNNEHRDEIKVIMRYAGPRMLFSHPILTIKHLLRKRN